MQTKLPLTTKISLWFIGCAFIGFILGTLVNLNPTLRSNKASAMRYTNGSKRLVRLNLKKRSGS